MQIFYKNNFKKLNKIQFKEFPTSFHQQITRMHSQALLRQHNKCFIVHNTSKEAIFSLFDSQPLMKTKGNC